MAPSVSLSLLDLKPLHAPIENSTIWRADVDIVRIRQVRGTSAR